MEFEESLNQVAAKVHDLKEGIETEEATKNAFIMPFIGQVLGYDVFNPTEVVPEFTADVGVKKGEKVDYALVHDGQVQILIECKKIGVPLSLENASQLYRYFAVTNARIGVLTNGQVWNFYMDIDEPNRMDSKPFLVLDLLDIDPTIIPALQKLTKPAFDLDSIASSAEELKYVGALKRAVGDEFKEPSDEFVKLLASHVYEGAFYASVIKIDTTEPDANEETNDEDESNGNDDDGIVTTEEEIAGYRIIKAIACSDVDPERVTMRDAKKYCAIFLDDNNRKPIVRLYFNTKQKYLGVFDENKNCERMPIDTLNGIYAYSEQIREEVRRLL